MSAKDKAEAIARSVRLGEDHAPRRRTARDDAAAWLWLGIQRDAADGGARLLLDLRLDLARTVPVGEEKIADAVDFERGSEIVVGVYFDETAVAESLGALEKRLLNFLHQRAERRADPRK